MGHQSGRVRCSHDLVQGFVKHAANTGNDRTCDGLGLRRRQLDPRGRWAHPAAPRSREYGPRNFQAFNTQRAVADFEADLQMRINGLPSFCEPRFLFRAQDAQRYDAVGLPSVGQSWRAKAVWAAIWRVDANGMHVLLAMKQVPGLPAEHGRWYR